ncbi:MAG: efflux RND transporter periplasmic adaptor subunit [Alphaproteobacteria bacterium]
MKYQIPATFSLAALLSLSLSLPVMAAERALSFGVSGVVAEVRVKSGDAVAKGAVLAVLDKRPLAAKKQAADARVASARVLLKLSQQRFKQLQELYDALSASAEQVEKSEITFVNARADLAEAVAKAAVCAWNLEHASLTAPSAGTIARVPGYTGQVVTTHGTAPQPVVVLDTP